MTEPTVAEAPLREIEVVAQLTPAELSEVRGVQSEMGRLQVQMRLQQAGAQELWRKIYVKYQLPPGVQLDFANGVFFRYAEVSHNGVVHTETTSQPEPPMNRQQRRRANRRSKNESRSPVVSPLAPLTPDDVAAFGADLPV